MLHQIIEIIFNSFFFVSLDGGPALARAFVAVFWSSFKLNLAAHFAQPPDAERSMCTLDGRLPSTPYGYL